MEYLFFMTVILGISINNVVISKRQQHWLMLNVNLKYQILYQINIEEG